MKKLYTVLVVAILASLVLAACGAGAAQADNLLDAIKQRGYILVSTDPNYEPQSFLNTEGKRPSDTKCPSDALTTAEMQGFDVDVAKAIGDALEVETCFATPSWDAITAGNWADKGMSVSVP
jgi:polar amino acid transport system substrate-binding protein